MQVTAGATLIAQNDNGSTPTPLSAQQAAASSAELSSAARNTGTFALAADAHAGQIGSADGTSTGGALVEIYELP